MKLWLLRPRDDLPHERGANPWVPWYDKCFGMVVRAPDESEARRIASADDMQEWNDPKFSTCTELVGDGEQGVVISDVRLA